MNNKFKSWHFTSVEVQLKVQFWHKDFILKSSLIFNEIFTSRGKGN